MITIEQGFQGYTFSEHYGKPAATEDWDTFLSWASWMHHVVPLKETHRLQIREALGSGWNKQSQESISVALLEAAEHFEGELYNTIKLTFSDYQKYLSGLIYGDERLLHEIELLSEERMNRNHVHDPSHDEFSRGDVDIQKIARAYIDKHVAHIPRVRGRAEQRILRAAQGHGKSEFKIKHLPGIEHTHVICDVDHIREWYAQYIGIPFDETDQSMIERCRVPSYRIADAVSEFAIQENQNLLMESNLARGSFWLDEKRNPIIHAAQAGRETIVDELVRPEYHGFVRSSMRRRKVAPKDYRFALGGLMNVVPFAALTNATVHIHDFADYIHEKTGFVSPFFCDRQRQFITALYEIRPKERILYEKHQEDLDIHGSVLDV